MNQNKTVTIHTNVSTDITEMFDRLYKGCRSRFIRNAMEMANNDRTVFEKIFFKDLLANNDNDLHLKSL